MWVGIYIQTDSKSPRRMKRRFGYVLACAVNGEDVTREGFGEAEETYHGACVLAIEKAMARIRKPCEITIYSENPWPLTQIKDQLKTWAAQDFLNAKGKPIANQKAWLHIWAAAQGHSIRTVAGKHEFTEWLLSEMRKRNETEGRNLCESRRGDREYQKI